jgi:hypothetical protein
LPSNREFIQYRGKTDAQFRIPNYNGEQRFFQGNTSASTKINPEVQEIYGTFGVDNNTGCFTTGAFWRSRGGMDGPGEIAAMILKHPFAHLGHHQYPAQAVPSSHWHRM